MPLLNRKEFVRLPVPEGVDPDSEVFYLETSGEVFLDYDEYFERMMQLNSTAWQCSMTGRTGLTFEEAKESEKEAVAEMGTFPAILKMPILYLVHHFSCRAKMDDLINDIFNFMRDRFFRGEEIKYRDRKAGKRKKRPVRVLSVAYIPASEGEDGAGPSSIGGEGPPVDNINGDLKVEESDGDGSKRVKKRKKGSIPGIPPPSCYRYRLQLIEQSGEDESDEESDGASGDENADKGHGDLSTANGTPATTSSTYKQGDEEEEEAVEDGERCTVVEHVSHTDLLRGRFTATKPKIRVLLKQHCEMADGRWTVKSGSMAELTLDESDWECMFTGPKPTFEQSRSTKQDKTRRDSSKVAKRESNPKEAEKKEASATRKAAKADKESKREKLKKKIMAQQEELTPLFEQAEHYEVEKSALAHWKQNEKLLSSDAVQQLKETVKAAKEAQRKRQLEKKRQERELAAERLREWKKPRDDLMCEDHKPLPAYNELKLPEWVPKDVYSDLLTISAFFRTFAQLLPKLPTGRSPSVGELAFALCSKRIENGMLFKIFESLLSARRACAEEEDFDEADVTENWQIGNELNCDLDHRLHGDHVKEVNREHERQRDIHGVSVRHLPLDPLTVTEVLRLTLATSGYYPGFDIVKSRQQSRGGIHCYEDEGFIFAEKRTDIMSKLEKATLFELAAGEKIALINVLIQQLLSYGRFRSVIDARAQELSDARRRLKELRQWYTQQKREALDARQDKEAEGDEDAEEGRASSPPKKKQSRELNLIRSYLRAVNAGLRVPNAAEVRRVALDSFPYAEMELEEIEEARQLQRSYYTEEVEKLVEEIFERQSRMGFCVLGRDRAYRSYSYLEVDTDTLVLLVEHPNQSQIPQCDEPTPIVPSVPPVPAGDKAEKRPEEESTPGETTETTTGCNAAKSATDLTVCAGKEAATDCPVHVGDKGGESSSYPSIFYYVEEDGIQKLLDALNPRGHREAELAENIGFFKRSLSTKMNVAARALLKADDNMRLMELFTFPAKAPSTAPAPATVDRSYQQIGDRALKEEFKEAILKLVDRLDTPDQRFGSVSSAIDREQWREHFKCDAGTWAYCREDQLPLQHSIDDEVLYPKEQLSGDKLTPIQKLGIAMLQVAQGVNFDAWKEPFALEDKKRGRLPSTHYVSWQRSVSECRSASALALHMKTMESSINWDYVKPWLKNLCKACAKRIGDERHVRCADCGRYFHLKCSKLELPAMEGGFMPLPIDWSCWQCCGSEASTSASAEEQSAESGEEEANAPKSSKQSESPRHVVGERPETSSSSLIAHLNGVHNDLYTTEEGNEGTSSVENHTGNESAAIKSDGDAENGSLESRKRRAKRFSDFLYVDEHGSSDSDSKGNDREARQQKRKKESPKSEEAAYRSLSMGLRETDAQRKAQLIECELAIKQALKQNFADLFAYPVSDKEVPGYSDIIRWPMDLGTMINKFKRLGYETPKQVWDDVQLIHSNCKTFNEDDSGVSEDADRLLDFLRPKFAAILNTE